MALQASDLIDPTGELTTGLFPGSDANALTSRVSAYLTAAALDSRVLAIIAGDATKADAAKRAYALWRAYTAVVLRMNSEPLQVNVTERGSSGYSVAQIAAIQALADQFDQQLDDLLPVSVNPISSQSMGIPNVFGW